MAHDEQKAEVDQIRGELDVLKAEFKSFQISVEQALHKLAEQTNTLTRNLPEKDSLR